MPGITSETGFGGVGSNRFAGSFATPGAAEPPEGAGEAGSSGAGVEGGADTGSPAGRLERLRFTFTPCDFEPFDVGVPTREAPGVAGPWRRTCSAPDTGRNASVVVFALHDFRNGIGSE